MPDRFFFQSRCHASTPEEAQALLAAQAEAAGYRVVKVNCHPVSWLIGEWDGTIELDAGCMVKCNKAGLAEPGYVVARHGMARPGK